MAIVASFPYPVHCLQTLACVCALLGNPRNIDQGRTSDMAAAGAWRSFTSAATRRKWSVGHMSLARQMCAASPTPTASPVRDASDPLRVQDYFGVHKLFTVKDLLEARVHLGHNVSATDPAMKQFVFGERLGTAIIDLDQTAVLLRQALNFLAHISYRGGIVLFVARQAHLVHPVEKAAIECGEYAHCRPWDSTIFTAPKTTFGLEVRLPDVIVILHTKDSTKYKEHEVIADSAKVGIPTVAVVDTDCNPSIVTYPIPGNDDTLESAMLYLNLFKKAILLGKELKKRNKEA